MGFEVGGAVFLDENFVPLPEEFEVDQPTTVYLQLAGEQTTTVDIGSTLDDDTTVDEASAVPVSLLGVSGRSISDPLELYPPWLEPQGKQGGLFLLRVAQRGWLVATLQDQTVARRKPKAGADYEVVVGDRLKVAVTRYHGFNYPGVHYYICSADSDDCADQVPLADVTWQVDPSPDPPLARYEWDEATGATHGWVRGIRATAGRTADGVVRLTAANATLVPPLRSAAKIGVVLPAHLGCCRNGSCPGLGTCTTTYAGSDADLEQKAIYWGDQYGVPPQYLMAQMMIEAGPARSGHVNPYAFRYEPITWDQYYLSGDSPATEDEAGTRKLTSGFWAFKNLGVAGASGRPEYLSCEASGIQPPAPCHAGGPQPPQPCQLSLQYFVGPEDPHWLIDGACSPFQEQPVFMGAPLQYLGPGTPHAMEQVFPLHLLVAPPQYSVDGIARRVDFPAPGWGPEVSFGIEVRERLLEMPNTTGFGTTLPDLATIRSKNPGLERQPAP